MPRYEESLLRKPQETSQQRVDGHSNNATSFGLYTLPARKLASMPSVDSERRHCVERVYPKTSQGSGSVTQSNPSLTSTRVVWKKMKRGGENGASVLASVSL